MNSLLLVIKGFFIGIANVIPGVSGGTIAIILGIYEKLIEAISHFFKNIKDNLKLLIPLGIGMILSIIVFSRVIEISYDNFPLPTMMFFIGLVAGGIPMLIKNIKGKKESKKISSYIVFLLAFALVIFMAISDLIFGEASAVSFLNMNTMDYILVFLVGVIASATMVIPGISGSLVLMLLGYYYPIISTINEFFKFNNLTNNFIILCIFGIGILFGIIAISKLIEFLFKKYNTITYFGVLGFIIASLIAIPFSTCMNVNEIVVNIPLGIASIITLIVGTTISYMLGKK